MRLSVLFCNHNDNGVVFVGFVQKRRRTNVIKVRLSVISIDVTKPYVLYSQCSAADNLCVYKALTRIASHQTRISTKAMQS